MNDRVLNEKESLELIAQMIQNTKSRMTRNSGAPVGLSLAPRAYEESPGNTERPTS